MSLRPGVSTTITRTKGNGGSYSGIGTVKQSITINPPSPLEIGRTHKSPANIGTVS